VTTTACIHTALHAIQNLDGDFSVRWLSKAEEANLQELAFFLDDLLDLHAWFDTLDIPRLDPETGLELDIKDRCKYLLS